ncbi:cell division protein FtsQ/DivIB [Dictyobacter arantiisoli]|uniref:POTRA domain-containing protein n=1 Tax=Dictyobacter arantiisoli TaxID=2014874 RepID=A0A5A5T9X4_9CHLR|nr:FtsQ-type POTRA domain-containing protein [Dictyobacter arantiisoli]GCF08301.1 hypothetical protein KDI_18650 [Dictyobacter arantiisoli]
MTERKKLPGQQASQSHSYNKLRKVYDPRRDAAGSAASRSAARSPRASQRVVTIPKEDPSSAWQTFEQRQMQLRKVRSRTRPPVKMVSRTFVQTGLRAPIGRIPAVRRPLPYHKSSIPLRRRRKGLRRGFFWKVLAVLFALICLVLLADFLLTGKMFRLKSVDVVGTTDTTLLQSIQQMHLKGQNIFLVNVDDLKTRIESSPLVASAVMSKQYPDQLTVTITERQPVVLWQTAQGTYSVDAQGKVIARIDSGSTMDGAQLATVVDLTPRGQQANGDAKTELLLRPGTYLKNIDSVFASQVWQNVPKLAGIGAFKLYYNGTMNASTTRQTGSVADSRGSYIIESPEGWKAYLGGSQDANPLANRLKELHEIVKLAHQKQMNIATIDLRYGLRPVFTLK